MARLFSFQGQINTVVHITRSSINSRLTVAMAAVFVFKNFYKDFELWLITNI